MTNPQRTVQVVEEVHVLVPNRCYGFYSRSSSIAYRINVVVWFLVPHGISAGSEQPIKGVKTMAHM